MTKKDLKTGMLVQLRDGDVALIINNTLIYKNGFDTLDVWENNLTFEGDEDIDIIKISQVLSGNKLSISEWNQSTINKNLLWSREEREEMTIEQIEKELGKKIKIIS